MRVAEFNIEDAGLSQVRLGLAGLDRSRTSAIHQSDGFSFPDVFGGEILATQPCVIEKLVHDAVTNLGMPSDTSHIDYRMTSGGFSIGPREAELREDAELTRSRTGGRHCRD